MHFRRSILFGSFCCLAVFLSACGALSPGSGGVKPDDIRTIAFQTEAARPKINTLEVTRITPTGVLQGTITPSPADAVDKLFFVSDVSIPDGTTLPAGAKFTKTWRVKNSGSSVWNSSYALVFIDGEMGAASVPLNFDAVRPGDEVDISVQLTAPLVSGKHRGNWTLRSGRTNKNFDQVLYAEIEVVQVTADANNFAGQICSAAWSGKDAQLPCFGSPSDANGYVNYSEKPMLENGAEENEPSLVVSLAAQNDSEIVGKYAPVLVAPGSHLSGVFSCFYQSEACNVRLVITYRVNNGVENTLGDWTETYDGSYTNIDVDLGALGLSGQTTQFTFYFKANGAGDQDKVFFLSPRLHVP